MLEDVRPSYSLLSTTEIFDKFFFEARAFFGERARSRVFSAKNSLTHVNDGDSLEWCQHLVQTVWWCLMEMASYLFFR
jgi:hypothetical protein